MKLEERKLEQRVNSATGSRRDTEREFRRTRVSRRRTFSRFPSPTSPHFRYDYDCDGTCTFPIKFPHSQLPRSGWVRWSRTGNVPTKPIAME